MQQEKQKELLKPKIDIVFQSLFSKNHEEITKSFVEVLLEEKIDKITINSDKELIRDKPDDKLGVLDLQVDINEKEKVDVEIQLIDRDDFVKRLIWYMSRLYVDQIKIGEKYSEIKKVVLVAIIDFEIKETKEIEEMETIWKLIETKKREKILTDNYELRIISLRKAKSAYERNKNDKKAQWLLFIDDPNSKEVSQIMEDNKEIKKAVVEVKEMTEDEKMERLAFLRQKAILDERSSRETGERIGRELGEARGKELGKKEAIENVVKSMIENGIDEETIKKVTKITQEELDKIKKESV